MRITTFGSALSSSISRCLRLLRNALGLLVMVAVGLAIGLLVLALVSVWNESPETVVSEGAPIVVVRVIDGDTVDLDISGQIERVRLIGVDTPETVSRSVPVQCYGAEASSALTGLLPVGSTVRAERGAETRDRYGRLLLYLYRTQDDVFVNEWLVEMGFAAAVSYAPNTEFEAHFSQLESGARQAERGLWGACDGPDQPLD